MTPERWQQIKQLVNSALVESAEARTTLLQQSCADDFALRLGAEALLSATQPLPAVPLTPERWQRIEQLFQAALELEAEKRAAFLAEACAGDAELRREVESLLVYQGAAGGLIQGLIHEAAGLLPHDEKARFTPGTTLNKRYRVLGLLGKGGMGEVYRADDLRLGQPVALKFLSEKLSQDKAMLARFHSEVAMAHRVTHPNVCRVHDIGEVITSSGALQFLSMEYVDGEDLSSLLRRIGRLPADKAIEIANQLCAGLAAAHEAGVLHRDLKPANVMIDGKGRVRITDFGLAGFAEQIRGNEIMAGTPAYMSPEQFAGKEVTTKSDIYALGLVLYEVFTGKRVFEGGSLDELKRMHESSAPTNPSSWVKNLDPLVERVILRCLEKDPGKRLASAKQVADALPGGDPLAAALALGETPSPEMVAAAGAKTGMRPMYAVACLLGIIACLITIPLLKHQVTMIDRLPIENSPEVMAKKGRDIANQFGWIEAPVDTAYGMFGDLNAISNKQNTRAWWEQLANDQRLPVYFWYRESRAYLQPEKYANSNLTITNVSWSNPDQNSPGMRRMTIDFYGRLSYFSATADSYDEPGAKAIEPDWKAVFSAAGFDISQYQPTESVAIPDSAYDTRAAWDGPHPVQPAVKLHIEAAALRGRIVFFSRDEAPLLDSLREQAKQNYAIPTGVAINIVIFSVIILVTLLAAAILARRNLRLNRGDRQGAARLGIFIFACTMIECFLLASHSPTNGEIDLFFQALALSTTMGGMCSLFYLALEPYVRKRWPETLVGWQMALTGKWRDPIFGRSLLYGLLAGLFCMALRAFTSWLRVRSGGALASYTDSLMGIFDIVRLVTRAIRGSAMFAAGSFFIIFLLCVLLRRDWIACLLLVAFSATYNLLGAGGNLSFELLAAVLVSFVVFLIIRKCGLLSMFVLQYCVSLTYIPATTNLSAWYAGYALSVLGILLTLSLYAFHTARGGQKVFTGKLLEE